MKTRFAFLAATVLTAAAVLTAPAHGISSPEYVTTGEHFRKNVLIDTETRLPDGGMLAKGSADVQLEYLGKGKVKATFFQGGLRKGEANGIVIVNVRPAGAARNAPGFDALGLGATSPFSFVKGAGKVDLAIGGQGQNQILIGLSLPSVQPSSVQKAREAAVAPAK